MKTVCMTMYIVTDASSKHVYRNRHCTISPAAGPVLEPPTPNPDDDIIQVAPPEEAVFEVILQWEPPPHPGGVLLRYIVNLVAVGERSSATERSRRQVDAFLDNCIVGGNNNVDRNFSVAAKTTSLTVNDASTLSYYV